MTAIGDNIHVYCIVLCRPACVHAARRDVQCASCTGMKDTVVSRYWRNILSKAERLAMSCMSSARLISSLAGQVKQAARALLKKP